MLGFVRLIFWAIAYDIRSKHKPLSTEEYNLIHDGQVLDALASVGLLIHNIKFLCCSSTSKSLFLPKGRR